MEDVRTVVEELESRGVRFRLDPDIVGFTYDWRRLEPGDPYMLGELIFEREGEVRRFLEGRARGTGFGTYAGVFRSAMCRIWNPPGMMVWLRERAPGVYADLERQADRVSSLWQEGALMEEFEAAVRRLEESHRAALCFFEECRKGSENGQG